MSKAMKQGVNVDQFAEVAALDKWQDGSGKDWSGWARREWERHFATKRGVSLGTLIEVAKHRETAPAFVTYALGLAAKLGVDTSTIALG